jgi:hypothetical protein
MLLLAICRSVCKNHIVMLSGACPEPVEGSKGADACGRTYLPACFDCVPLRCTSLSMTA